MNNQTLFPPDVPVVDSHVHFWDPKQLRYGWFNGTSLDRAFLPGDLRTAASGLPVEQIVFVEAGAHPADNIREVSWVAGFGEENPRIGAIVANAALEDGVEAENTLARLMASPLVKGVRRNLQGEATDYCLQASFVAGVRLLSRWNLSFDVCIRHEQLPAATELAQRCSDVLFILDHIGKPAIAKGILDPWRDHLRDFAALPNTVCKLSGLVTEADRANWTPDDLRPYVEHVIACFGWERVMYGSDWPVATLATEYGRWATTLLELTKNCTVSERRALFADNARRVYRLPSMSAPLPVGG